MNPYFAPETPILQRIQYTEADGTLVTRAGLRATHCVRPTIVRSGFSDEDSAFAGGLNPTDAEPGKYLEWTELCV
jgi:hypothetical protein